MAQGISIKTTFVPNDRCVVLTKQFLGRPHAPSGDALDFAGILRQNYDRDVLIVNSLEFSPEFNRCFVPPFLPNVQINLAGDTFVVDNGELYAYFQPESGRFETAALAATINRIESFDPAMILTIGSPNLVSELFIDRCFPFLYPTTKSVPITQGNYFHTWMPPTENDNQIMEEEGLTDYFLFAQHPGFAPPLKTTQLHRSAFGIPEHA